MTCIIFETPGLIDSRAFTVMGMSAKPNSSNPIGYFGTGLKYAVATLVRLGAEPVVWIGKDKHVFEKKPTKFRGQDFEMLRMRVKRWTWKGERLIDLPYTTQHGRNWQAWMAFRELESNTRDEGGHTMEMNYVGKETDSNVCLPLVKNDKTLIAVCLPAFTQAYHERDNIFLPEAQREGMGVQVVNRQSNHLYWRGLKVYELPKPSLFTYNFLSHLDLTEDRTLANVYLARAVFARWLVKCERDDVVERVLTATDKFWEHGLDFPHDEAPSAAFHRVMSKHPKRVSAGAWGYYSRYDSRITPQTFKLDEHHPLPWRVEGSAVVDKKGTTVFDAPYGYHGKWGAHRRSYLETDQPGCTSRRRRRRMGAGIY